MGFFKEEKKRGRSPISIALIIGAALFSIVWFLRSLSMALATATAAALLTWRTSTWLQPETKSAFQEEVSNTLSRASEKKYKFQEKEFIPLVAGVLAWGVSKFLVGQFLGAIVGGMVGWILYNRLEEKERRRLQELEEEERRKKRVGEVVSGVLGFGAAAGAVALAAWGISKASDGGSSGEPWRGDEDEDKMMKAPGRDYLMPRKDFEENPSEYFRRLRGKK